MNANELADSRKEWTNDLLSLNEWSIDAETMLRQQQAEIEALKQSKFKDDNKVNFELTDEEIIDALYIADITLNNLSDGDIPIKRIESFARAILRKGQEK